MQYSCHSCSFLEASKKQKTFIQVDENKTKQKPNQTNKKTPGWYFNVLIYPLQISLGRTVKYI
jgi:hypothetical protein